jgi:O-antigen/teichoic acid export membrane protein
MAVRGNFVWMSAGGAVFSASQWAMVSVIAKLGSPEMVGAYALGVAVATPPLMLAQLNLRSVLATDVRQEHPFRQYQQLRALSLALTLIGVVLFACLSHVMRDAATIVLVCLILALQWMSDIYHGLLQAHERMDRVAISLTLAGVAGLAALVTTMALSGSLNLALAAVLASRLAAFLLYDSSLAVREYLETSRPDQTSRHTGQLRILTTALPLGVVMMIGSLTPNLPRYFISHHLGQRTLGLFSAVASLTAAANLLINALGQAASPRLAKLYSTGNTREFEGLTFRLIGAGVLFGVLGAAGAALVGPQVLTVLFRPEYAAHADVLITLSVVAAATYIASLLGYAVTACRCFQEQVPLQIAGVAVAALACALLVPAHGLQGAALACAAAPIVQIGGCWIVLRSALAKIRPAVVCLLPKPERIAL